MACRVKLNRHGNLAFRLYWHNLTSWEGTDLSNTPENYKYLAAQAVLISREIERGAFDYLKWFPNGNKAHLFKPATEQQAAPLTLRQYYDEWIKDKIPPLIKKSRGAKYRSHFNAYILPLHGDIPLRAYSVSNIRDLRICLIDEKKLAVKTAKNAIGATLRAFFRDAKAEGVIEKNPFDDLPAKWWPRTVTPEPDPFTEEERDEIISYFFSKHWRRWPHGCAFLYTLFWGGMRPSELTGRRWRDVDLKTGMLSITNSRTGGEEGDTKTANSKRTIRLLQPVVDYLAQMRPIRAQPNDYIFLDQRGNPINQWRFGERHFQGALSVLKIRHRDFYHTRHTFISVMLSHGENPKRIAEYVGNSPEVIYRNYGKWLGGDEGFGNAALQAAKPKPLPKPVEVPEEDLEKIQLFKVVRGRGFEPLRPFEH
jgi:integrase